ncbi:GntP family permease [Kocuria coralli]|uniref:GntP family permease n=1 Tax=Kocuria coralli TaxID=1461025 RepID=A0A5J5KUV4_9MICC|nr:GntP family permease [Kocuria coralli]
MPGDPSFLGERCAPHDHDGGSPLEDAVPALSAGWLLVILAGAITALLVLIIKVRLNANLALILISALTAVATRIPTAEIVPTMIEGFGTTLGNVALLIGLGAMLGRMLEQSGGADVLAEGMLRIFGEKRAPLALSVASLLFGFPIFFDAGLVVMLPIIFSIAQRFGGSVLIYALPAAGAFQVMHGLMPPHPGPVAATGLIGANLGLVLMTGLLISVPVWYLAGYRFTMWLGRRYDLPVPEILGGTQSRELQGPRPSMAVVLSLLLLPVLLICMNTTLSTLVADGLIGGSGLVDALIALGQTPVALFITVLVALFLLGFQRGIPAHTTEVLVDKALMPVVTIIFLAGTGGMFGAVLRASGIGSALADGLETLGLPLIVAAYLISVTLRVAQGSATVAVTTTAALLAPAVLVMDLGELQLALIVLAMAAGSFFASHVNDSGFWLVRGFLEMDTPTALKVWTTTSSVISLTSFALVAAVYAVVS